MLPKHYQGFQRAFPDLTQADHEALFNAGLITPGHVKKATREELLAVLPKSKVDKVRPEPKKVKVKPEPAPEPEEV